ncbi:MAG: NPCBM/NEW2 domain-containing protein [Armatimonadetes bacterium]|nr:NPCBM/NEW2 domain-containing protein [Armatimonadota bacterium]
MTAITFLQTALLGLALTQPGAATETRLSELDLSGLTQGYGSPQVDVSAMGHAPAKWTLRLDGKATEFRAAVGVQEYADNVGVGSVEFVVLGDGRELFRSGVMRGGQPAKDVKVDLTGLKELVLQVTDGGDGNSSDHADWLEPVIVHNGAPLPLPPTDPVVPDPPGAPPSQAAKVEFDAGRGTLRLTYNGGVLLDAKVTGRARLEQQVSEAKGAVTQVLTLTGTGLKLAGSVQAGEQSLAAETRGEAQKRFPLVRTSHGASRNLRNNAVYDRAGDWCLLGPADGSTRITPTANHAYRLACTGDTIRLTFQPRLYSRHRNLPYYRPWTYRVRQDSITGWCSWWAYMRGFRQTDLDGLLAVWKDKRLADYGYRFIQIDDCFQGGEDGGRPGTPKTNGYPGGRPETWLKWRTDAFPGGLTGYAEACRQAGFEPGVWIGSGMGDLGTVEAHPDWFVHGPDGKPFAGDWVGFAVDSTIPAAADALVRPIYRGIRQAGYSYVKIDTLRHRLYDNLHHNPGYCAERGKSAAEIFRSYVQAAREELGPDTFLLACWGVLPEVIGLADACRIGGDGYGPVTMQSYNSFNGIVWRNDPDHCDVYPRFKPAESGNVTHTNVVTATNSETLLRPALASIAGCMLMLSDKPEVYRDDANLIGARRASPVLFSVPGQLYDFEPAKSDNLRRGARLSITSGGPPAPVDADQFGPVCPWWLNEIDRPFEHWSVLHHLNWTDRPMTATTVALADLGLDADRDYLVYEFWSQRFVGSVRGSLAVPELAAQGLASYALRERLDRPQLLSTSRHLTQGGVDLLAVNWRGKTLSGSSKVVAGDRYELVLHAPAGFTLAAATIADKAAEAKTDGEVLRVAFTPTATGTVAWSVSFH